MERQAPRQLLYENQLPLAIESKSTRRLFFPEGGSTYGPSGGANPNIIRIPINADSLLDVQHSYLSFNLVNAKNADANTISPDIGVPFIRRLRIESAGTTLEDIDAYGKLYGGVLFPTQASAGAISDATITTAGIGEVAGTLSALAAAGATGGPTAAWDFANFAAADDNNAGGVAARLALYTSLKAAVDARTITGTSGLNKVIHNIRANTELIGNGANTVRYNVPLVSALLNMEKYLPLVMMNAGITLELELDVANSVGITGAAGGGAGGVAEWQITDVRYVAHLIDLQRDFYDKMRMVMEGSGGVLQLTGSTFRHYSGQSSVAGADAIINLPARVKSIQSVFFTQTPAADLASSAVYGVSNSVSNGLDSFQFRVGSVVYPPTAIQLTRAGDNYINKGEAYQELRKAFGTCGDYTEGGVMLASSGNQGFLPPATIVACSGQGVQPCMSPLGLDFQSFPKTALESGVNTADRSLNMSLELKRTGGVNAACVIDAWIMADAIFYVNLDGSVSVSV